MQFQHSSEIKSEINMTPLIDVVLVLLIIFMVVTPMIVARDVQVPETGNPGPKRDPGQKIVYLNESGDLFFEEQPVVAEALVARLQDLYRRDAKMSVLLQADRRLQYDRVMQVLDLIAEAGFPQVGLIAKPAEQTVQTQ